MTAGDSARALAGGPIHFLLASVLQYAMIIESRTAKLAAQKKPVLRSGCNLADRLQSCLLHRRPRAAYFCSTARCARILSRAEAAIPIDARRGKTSRAR